MACALNLIVKRFNGDYVFVAVIAKHSFFVGAVVIVFSRARCFIYGHARNGHFVFHADYASIVSERKAHVVNVGFVFARHNEFALGNRAALRKRGRGVYSEFAEVYRNIALCGNAHVFAFIVFGVKRNHIFYGKSGVTVFARAHAYCEKGVVRLTLRVIIRFHHGVFVALKVRACGESV